MTAHVVKRNSREAQPFDGEKLEASIAAACLAVRALEGEAATIAHRVHHDILAWLEKKTEVTSADVRRVAAQQLSVYHPEAAYMYEHHRLMI